jgi:hypothetical protein
MSEIHGNYMNLCRAAVASLCDQITAAEFEIRPDIPNDPSRHVTISQTVDFLLARIVDLRDRAKNQSKEVPDEGEPFRPLGRARGPQVKPGERR